MKKIMTPEMKNKKQEVVAPSKNTLDLLKQFARVYVVQQKLPKPLNSFCSN